jgi:hypothetical protein
MTIQNLKIGQYLKDGNLVCKVVTIYADKFEVQYISGACFTYRQIDLDNKILDSYIG